MEPASLGHRIAQAQNQLLLLVFAVTLGALAALFDWQGSEPRLRLQIDPTVDRLLNPDAPARVFQASNRELFGGQTSAIVAVGRQDFLSAEGLALIRKLHRQLQLRPEVESVTSLASVVHSFSDADGFLAVEPFARLPANTPGEIEFLRDAIAQNPLVRGQLLSRDGLVAAFVLNYAESTTAVFDSVDYVPTLKQSIRDVAPGVSVWLTGSEYIKAGVARTVGEQLQRLIPLILLLTGIIAVAAFRSVRAALATLLTVGIALLWTLAILVMLDTPLTLVSAIMPPVVITLGLAYAMHAQSDFFAHRRTMEPGTDIKVVVAATIDALKLPLLLTGITTIAGFLALLLNPLTAVKEFAAFSAIGIAIDLFLGLCVLPILLGRFGCTGGKNDGSDFFERMASRLAAIALRHRRLILTSGGVILLIGLVSLSQVQVGTNYVRGFAIDHPIRVDFEEINSELSGVNGFSVVLEGFVDDTFTEPEVLRAVQRLQAWLQEQPEVGATQSIVDYLQLIRSSFGESPTGTAAIPDSRDEIKQLLLFGASPAQASVVDRRFATAQILVRSYEENSAAIRALLERMEPQLNALPRRLEATVTGDTVLLAETVADIASGQWLTVGVAALVVYLVLAALFTSWRVAMLAMLPNLLPVAIYYGFLGMFNVPLNPTTSLIACIVLGVAVDDTIHFLVRFNAASRRLADESKAVEEALRAVLRPVTFTTVALCAGFGVLCISPLQNQVQFGALAAATLAMAWVSDVLFTPALGSGVRLVTLWDVLRLDLGSDPQHSIPLFAGLSSRQARTFALLSRLQEVENGERVITEGDAAEDIYVIIDGKLRAYLDREEGERELSIMERGTVMGEVGYFGQKRTCHVDSLTPARLLAFNGADLDQLRRRYPRIAATVYRNLNLAQAQRLANMAKMI